MSALRSRVRQLYGSRLEPRRPAADRTGAMARPYGEEKVDLWVALALVASCGE